VEPVDNEAKVRQKVHGMVVSMVASVGGGADVVAAALGRYEAFRAAFPAGTKLRSPAYLAEILVFHALKQSGRPFDPARFRAASPVGAMPMGARRWLLEYRQFLPKPERVPVLPSARSYLDAIPDADLRHRALSVLPSIGGSPRLSNPRMQAAVATLVAARDLGKTNIAGLLQASGFCSLSSVYNAATHAGLGDLVRARRVRSLTAPTGETEPAPA
jgi:hypothetical protein